MTRARAAAAAGAVLVWIVLAVPRQYGDVGKHLKFTGRHVRDSVGTIRREQNGRAFQDAIERIASEIPREGEYLLVESTDPGCDPYWIRGGLVPRVPRSIGREDAISASALASLLARTPRPFVVGCTDGAPALLEPGTVIARQR